MFMWLNELKGLIIDLSSFSEDDDDLWTELKDEKLKVLFFSKEPHRLLRIRRKKKGCLLYGESIAKGFYPQKKEKIVKMLEKLELRSYEVALISANHQVVCEAQFMPISTIEISTNKDYENQSLRADFQINSVKELNAIISGNLIGYISEVLSCPIKLGTCLNYIKTEKKVDSNRVDIISGGRYFGTKDPRYKLHELSNRILKNKNYSVKDNLGYCHIEEFTEIFIKLIGLIEFEERLLITRIPPKQGEERDWLGEVVDNICRTNDRYTNGRKILTSIKDFKSQKECNTLYERMENVKDAFQCTSCVNAEHVILIDDVITTGCTAISASKALYNSGAEKVTIVTLAINQRINLQMQKNIKIPTCNKCGSEIVMRFNSENKCSFWGCRWFPECKKTMEFSKGLKKYYIENEIKREEDADLDDFEF